MSYRSETGSLFFGAHRKFECAALDDVVVGDIFKKDVNNLDCLDSISKFVKVNEFLGIVIMF